MGTVKMYLDAEVLGGKKLVEAAVIEGKSSKETDTNFAELIEKVGSSPCVFS